jgi:hypothetical protein
MRSGFEQEPTHVSAIAFGLATIVAPWLVMQPALGLGVMAARAPKPAATRAVNLSNHTVLGLGLCLGTTVVKPGIPHCRSNCAHEIV